MKKKLFLMYALISLGLSPLFYSCSEKAASRPNFVFKPAPKTGVAAKALGEEISEEKLFAGMEGDLYEAESRVYQLKMDKLKSFLLEKFMSTHPDKKNLSNDEFLEKVIAKGKTVTDKDVEAFIKEKNIPAQHVNDQLKERIKSFIDQENKKKAVDTWLAEQTAKNPVEVYIAKPQRPVFDVNAENGATYGPAGAKVTIVEFSDFQCPFCARGASILSEIKKAYGDKVRIVFKNFPLSFHQHARVAAEASLCAFDQGEKPFWKMHDAMFADQEKLTKEDLIAKAKKEGLDSAKFEQCLNTNQFAAKVDEQLKEGEKLGVKSTPTFYVNGKLINGAQPFEVFAEEIDYELNK